MYEEFSSGRYSEEALRRILDNEFLDLPRRPGKQQFSHILKNPFYYGDFQYSHTVFHGNPEYHPRLISFSLWAKVQKVLSQPHRNRRKISQRDHAYLGLIKCGGFILDDSGNETEEACGCSITGEEKKKLLKNGSIKYHYYWHCGSVRPCSQRNSKYLKARGLKQYLPQHSLELLLEEVFRPLKFTPDVVKWMQEMLMKEHNEKSADHKQEVGALLRRREMLQTMINRAYEDKLTGVITESAWKDSNSKWVLESEEILKRVEALDDHKQDYILNGVELIELVQHLETIYKNATSEKKRRMVEIVSSNHVLRNGKLCFDYRKPFDVLVESGGKEKWLTLVATYRIHVLHNSEEITNEINALKIA